MNIEQFANEVKEAYLAEFPQGWIYGGYGKMLGEFVSFTFGIQPKELIANNIEHNDPARQIIMIHDVKDGEFADKICAEGMNNSMLIKPQPGEEWLAFSSVKFGYRKKTAAPEKVLEHIKKYFKKMRKVVDENKDKLAHQIEKEDNFLQG